MATEIDIRTMLDEMAQGAGTYDPVLAGRTTRPYPMRNRRVAVLISAVAAVVVGVGVVIVVDTKAGGDHADIAVTPTPLAAEARAFEGATRAELRSLDTAPMETGVTATEAKAIAAAASSAAKPVQAALFTVTTRPVDFTRSSHVPRRLVKQTAWLVALGSSKPTLTLIDADSGTRLMTVIPTPPKWPSSDFPTNTRGLTYGAAIDPGRAPDLVAVVGDSGVTGFAYNEDLSGPSPRTPEEALEQQSEQLEQGGPVIPVFDVEGLVAIDTFTAHLGQTTTRTP